MADQTLADALVLLTKLNSKILDKLNSPVEQAAGGGISGGDNVGFKDDKGIIIDDFNQPAIDKLSRAIGGGGRKSPFPMLEEDETKRGGGGGMLGFFSAIGKLLGLGAGIAGMAVIFATADKVMNFLGDGSSLRTFLINLGAGLSGFIGGIGLQGIGMLVGAGGVFAVMNAIPGVKVSGIDVAMGITSIGLGLAGFFTALALNDAVAKFLAGEGGTPGSSLNSLLTNIGEGIGSLQREGALEALKPLFMTGAIFGAIAGVDPTGYAQKAGMGATIGLGVIGFGLAGFISAFALSDPIIRFIAGESDPGRNLKNLMVNVAEGLGAFTGPQLSGFGDLLKAGAIFGAATVALAVPTGGISLLALVGAPVGMTIVGMGIAGFLTAISHGDTMIRLLSGADPGLSIKKLMINTGEGLTKLVESVKVVADIGIGKFMGASAALAGFLGVTGIGGVLASFGDLVGDFVDFINPFKKAGQSPFDPFLELAQEANQLMESAEAIEKLSNILVLSEEQMAAGDIKTQMNTLSDAIDDLNETDMTSINQLDSFLNNANLAKEEGSLQNLAEDLIRFKAELTDLTDVSVQANLNAQLKVAIQEDNAKIVDRLETVNSNLTMLVKTNQTGFNNTVEALATITFPAPQENNKIESFVSRNMRTTQYNAMEAYA